MGMLVMLSLICYTTYANADAPPVRGFSHIELWMIGMLVPILVAIIEYGVTLCLYRYWELKELEQKVFVKGQMKLPDSNKKVLTFKKMIFFEKCVKCCQHLNENETGIRNQQMKNES